MKPGFNSTVALALLFGAAMASEAGPVTSERTGYAYEMDEGALVYMEEHQETMEDGRVIHSVVTYRKPDGSILGTKQLDFSGNATGPDFRLENVVNGHLEGSQRREDGRLRVFFRRTEDHDYREKTVEPPGRGIIDGGFDRFIESNWERLLSGEVFERPFLVPSFRRFIDFRIYLERRTEAEVVFIMEPASLLLRFVGEKIVVTYDRDDGTLVRYRGLSNMRDRDGDNYKVRVEFPDTGKSQALAAEAAGTGPSGD